MNEQINLYSNKLAYETDSWDLKAALEAGENIVAVDAAGLPGQGTHRRAGLVEAGRTSDGERRRTLEGVTKRPPGPKAAVRTRASAF